MKERFARRSFPWAVIAMAALSAIPLGMFAMVATYLRYQAEPPTCFGIGWGCSLKPTDTGIVVGVIWLFAVACWAGLILITELFWRRVAVVRSVATLIAAIAALTYWVVASLPFLG